KYDPMYGFTLSLIGDKGMIEVLGEGGTGLKWEGKDVHLILHRRNGPTDTFRFDEGGDDIWQSDVSYYSRAHANQIREFVDALIAGKRPRYCGEDGYRAIKTTMAAICSVREGVPVKVSEMTDERFGA
ncbi:MAG TPA: Gfo/Idh/MocA family oxidoreductase, partial [Geminicoccus sp.]|uniref:Gfo/Idh/MocA family oxidoreductase n=1 Tax=Geminicoccus sp. TaxID=2024832 RepID=UPI002CDF157A